MQGGEITIIITLSLLVVVSPYFSKLLKLPTTPVEIILGMLAGAVGLLHDHHIFILIAEVGFFYLMFLAGTEVDLQILLKMDRTVKLKTFLYIALLYLLSVFSTMIFSLNMLYAAIIPLISVGLILTLIKEYGKDQPWLELSMIVGTVGEIVSIAVLTITAGYLEFGGEKEFYITIGYLVLFIAFILLSYRVLKLLFWWFPHIKTALMPIYQDKDEQDIRLSMAIFFMLIALMLFLHLEVAFGAFVAGIFISAFFRHKQELPHKLESFGFGFLIPIFFIHIGSTFDVKAIFFEGLAYDAAIITFIMIMVRFLSSLVFFKKLKLKGVALFSLSHSMPLTLLIAASTIAYHTKVIDQHSYFAFVLAALLEVLVAMIAIKLINKKSLDLNQMH
jgi:Kef-type K+ transport system membrane component KefB